MRAAGLLERRAVQSYVLPVALLLLYAWIALITAWLADDSFFSFRQVLNAIDGGGFTANYGQRVQAFTHPSWVLLLTTVVSVTREIYLTTIVLSVALSLAAVFFVVRYARLLPEGRSTPLFLYSFLVTLAFSKAFTDYMTSGLENPLSFFLVGLVVYQARRQEIDASAGGSRWLLFVALALAFLNRFDYAVLLGPLALYLILTTSRKRMLGALLPGATIIASWVAFSLLYFGAPLPNTYYAKLLTGYPMDEVYARGAAYFSVNTSQDPATMALVVFGTIAGFLARSWLNRTLSLGIVLYGAFIFRAGGDFMQGRFFAVLAYVAIFNLVSLDERSKALRGLKAVFLIAIVSAVAVGPKPPLSDRNYRNLEVIDGVGDERGAWYRPYGLLSPFREWPAIGPPAPSQPTEYRLSCAGSDGLRRRDVFWIDICGLADPFMSRLPAIRSRDWRIGHHFRKVPTGYGDVMTGRSAALDDPALQGLFDDVQRVVSGPIFSAERMGAIVRLHRADSYRFDRQRYTDPAVRVPLSSRLVRAQYAQVSHEPPRDGAQWLVPVVEGQFWAQDDVATSFDAGIRIAVQPPILGRAVSLSLDADDTYQVTINGGEFVTRIEPSPGVANSGVLVSHTIELPEPWLIEVVRIDPIEGDGYYALGHLLIEDRR